MENKESNKFQVPEITFGAGVFSGRYNHIEKDWPLLSVRRAFELGINAFDTSPYYGDSEKILGSAFHALQEEFPRSSYYIFTKVGRYGPKNFDYTAKRIQESVKESCRRLCTDYLNVVYAHDVEFVNFEDVVEEGGALPELFKLKEQGKIRYVGISGYPLDVLLKIARFQYERDQPIDAILSYSHYCLHNIKLVDYIQEFKYVGVQYIMNASPLSMGLLRNSEPPEWHPASTGLRHAVTQSAVLAARNNLNISKLALQFALDYDDITSTVIGLSNPSEVDEAIAILKELHARKKGKKTIPEIEKKILNEIHQILEPHFNRSWDSPPKDH
ncbi:Aldo/keto reductase [Rhizophagus irregularis]|uniref:Aldo/keto reductase n=3 Tax=Rhizophagus irregularis TaxID=588596 RepID=A0A2I1DU82_9GLOM|nr:L-galactose dehydrogenase [Rhizophagus irregularis DAOM 181602=DAOM 197198]EXX79063.1 D-arabinose 1-dehydrogenase (NAD(P)(+)) ARA2 [Rhizophagus irregularis DAOM 197198w]PKC15907.1 Aldo/keto reductase [Rhizophagus irregularis]PKC76071.1 Aldo/keto reductase [Rhizophagus irregularis]PKK70268.1 Aldo/keto reductase [Rhizophagus irregularis]PKY13432.1 Aldo/keto reductase [Rhizophagus irregularis]|eukprot:XP_025170846.1 L-galactose dehydrogenase [Rhizophagus irregularis DAOM 181602=DAOM 197198]